MNITINEENSALIKQMIESGRYHSPEQVLAAALHLLEERDKKLDALRIEVQHGLDQLDRGEYTDYTDETLDQLFDELEAEAFKDLGSE